MQTLVLAAIRCSLMFTAAAAFSLAHPGKANLITNGGFETGDFVGWTQSGDTSNTFVTPGYYLPPHSGNFEAALGPTTFGYLSQTLATVPGPNIPR